MRRVVGLASVLLLAAVMLPAQPSKGTIRCTLTGKTIRECCCEQRDGKLYCTLAKKSIEGCCCEPKQK